MIDADADFIYDTTNDFININQIENIWKERGI